MEQVLVELVQFLCDYFGDKWMGTNKRLSPPTITHSPVQNKENDKKGKKENQLLNTSCIKAKFGNSIHNKGGICK